MNKYFKMYNYLKFKDETMNIIYMKGQICTLIDFDIEERDFNKIDILYKG